MQHPQTPLKATQKHSFNRTKQPKKSDSFYFVYRVSLFKLIITGRTKTKVYFKCSKWTLQQIPTPKHNEKKNRNSHSHKSNPPQYIHMLIKWSQLITLKVMTPHLVFQKKNWNLIYTSNFVQPKTGYRTFEHASVT